MRSNDRIEQRETYIKRSYILTNYEPLRYYDKMHKKAYHKLKHFRKSRHVAFSRFFRATVPPNNKTPYRANLGQYGAYIQHYARFLCFQGEKLKKGIKKEGGIYPPVKVYPNISSISVFPSSVRNVCAIYPSSWLLPKYLIVPSFMLS